MNRLAYEGVILVPMAVNKDDQLRRGEKVGLESLFEAGTLLEFLVRIGREFHNRGAAIENTIGKISVIGM